MQTALPIVIVAVVVVAGLVGIAAVLLSRGPYNQIGRSGITFDTETRRADAATTRDEEIGQMLAASNTRRAATGRPLLELSDLAPAPDAALRAEVREIVEALSARRVARGLEPLDVDAEVERRLSG